MSARFGTLSVRTAVRALRVAFGAVAVVGGTALVACSHDPIAGSGRDRIHATMRLSLSTGVVAAPGAMVDARVTFTPPGASESITVARDSLMVSTGDADGSLALVGDVAPCVSAFPSGSNCQLDLTVRLTRDGALLDESTQHLSVSDDTEQLTATPVQLYEVASIGISPTAVSGFQTVDSVLLTATPRDRSGSIVAARTTAWSVVSGGVSVSAGGMLRAVQPGAATVRASIGGRTQDLSVSVLAPLTATVAPANATGEVLIEASIGVTFAENVSASSVNATTVALTRNGAALPATRSTVGKVVTITPTAPMTEFQTQYVVTVTPGVTSTTGTRLLSNLTSNFTTIFWDPSYSYRLTNNSTGAGLSLDLDGDSFCTMSTSGSSPGQAWFFLPILGFSGYATMHNVAGGPQNAIEGADLGTPCFRGLLTVLFSGMIWRAAPAPPIASAAYYLQNLNFGANKSLGTANEVPEMHPTANTTSQFWTFARLARR